MEYILQIMLDKDDLKVLSVQIQKSVENIYGRQVCFDVFTTDTQGKLYNIEVQRADSGAIPQRAFCYLHKYGLQAVFANKDKTPNISFEFPVTDTPRSSKVINCYKCGEGAVKNPLDSRI